MAQLLIRSNAALPVMRRLGPSAEEADELERTIEESCEKIDEEGFAAFPGNDPQRRPPGILKSGIGMEIHLDSHSERLIERQLRSGRYHSPEQVVASALEALTQSEQTLTEDDVRRRAVQDMLEFAAKHGFTLGEGVRIRDLIHEGHKY